MSYQCPQCSHNEFVPISMVVAPREGRPWWARKVGLMAHCARCLAKVVISRTHGVYRVRDGSVPAAGSPTEQLRALFEGSGGDQELRKFARDLLDDANLPDNPGV